LVENPEVALVEIIVLQDFREVASFHITELQDFILTCLAKLKTLFDSETAFAIPVREKNNNQLK